MSRQILKSLSFVDDDMYLHEFYVFSRQMSTQADKKLQKEEVERLTLIACSCGVVFNLAN